MSLQPEAPSSAAAPPASLSLLERAIAVFTRPASAWTGLAGRQQWWFPLIVVGVLNVLFMLAVYDRALVPDFISQWEAQVEAGAMQPAQMEQAEAMTQGWAMKGSILGVSLVGHAVITLVFALLAVFGVGFILGSKLPFRLAFEVAAWSGLVKLVEFPLLLFLVWSEESLKSAHLSLAALLPAPEAPAKWHSMLVVALDGVGPFNVWLFVVGVLGCSALSGAPRRNVAWVLGGLGLALVMVAALFSGCAPSS